MNPSLIGEGVGSLNGGAGEVSNRSQAGPSVAVDRCAGWR